jgi:hypothetical protein
MIKHFTTLAFTLGLGAVVSSSLSAKTIFVGNCGTPSTPTIQAAVNASAAGGTVSVCPGTYPEQVTIAKNLTLSGVASANANLVVITSPAGGVVVNTSDLYQAPSFPVAAQVLVQNATVTLSNITVDGSGNNLPGCGVDLRGIYYQNSSGTIANVATRNQVQGPGLTGCQTGQGIFVQSGYNSTEKENVTVQNNSVRAFQKNGITADGSTLTINISGNSIVGQGPTTGAAENGVQVSDGATGKVQNNTIINNIWAPDTASDPGDAAAGIIIVGSESVDISNNTVGSTQFAIGVYTFSAFGSPGNPNGLADKNSIRNNQIVGTQIFDAVDVCSNDNMIQNNSIFASTESAVHLDSTGTNNNVLGNTINEACAAILEGATPNNIGNNNDYFNVVSEVVAGNVCSAASVNATAASFSTAESFRVSGAKPMGKPRPVR